MLTCTATYAHLPRAQVPGSVAGGASLSCLHLGRRHRWTDSPGGCGARVATCTPSLRFGRWDPQRSCAGDPIHCAAGTGVVATGCSLAQSSPRFAQAFFPGQSATFGRLASSLSAPEHCPGPPTRSYPAESIRGLAKGCFANAHRWAGPVPIIGLLDLHS